MDKLALPPNLNLPCFVYGLLQKGELAFPRVRPFVEGDPLRATVNGSLRIRDGLPLLVLHNGVPIQGYILRFAAVGGAAAYGAICDFEPSKHYKWEEAATTEPRVVVNVLVGLSPEKGSSDLEGDAWSSAEDPVFKYGVREARAVADRDAAARFDPAPPHAFDWPRFFRLQMAYLLLWSAIERYTALAHGPRLGPMKRIETLGTDPAFRAVLGEVVTRTDGVVQSDDPGKSYRLDKRDPDGSANYFYCVRCNLSHRGKGAWSDGEKVRLALRDLLAIFERVLQATVFHNCRNASDTRR